MSSDSSDDDNAGVRSPMVSNDPPVHRINSPQMRPGSGDLRTALGDMDGIRESQWMESYAGERNLFDALGYVKDPQYQHYRSRYERTDTAPALVDKLPKKAWAQPEIRDPEADDEQNEFEKAINEFLAGQYTEEDPIEVMERASRMERLGHYALIFLGFADDAIQVEETDEDDGTSAGVDALENEADSTSLESKDAENAINYLTPYDEARVDEDQMDWVNDNPLDPRFGKPRSYHVDLGNDRPQAQIHHTRVIHVVGDVFDNALKSPSVLKKSLNRIDDIEKILGGSAEGFWRAAYQGLVISPPEVNGQLADFEDDGEDLHGQIDRYINNFSREIFTPAEIDTIDVTVEDPTGHLESQYKDLSNGHNIPQSIMMGNETGERATDEDRRMWHERVGKFRVEYCEPSVLRPLIDRLIDFGIIPEPEGGKGAYDVNWPDLREKSDQEKANIIQTKANAINTGTGGNPFVAMTPEEFRQEVLGWKPELGAEVQSDQSNVNPTELEELERIEQTEVDEDNERVQKQFEFDSEEYREELIRVNRSFEEEDKVRTPDGRGVIVDVLTEGFDEEGVSVEASDEEPKYVVVTETEDVPFAFYPADELEAEDWDSGVESPLSDLEESEGEDRENVLRVRLERALAALTGRGNVAGDGHFTWPRSWRESDKPARLIALDAWVSMGGSVSACIREMRGDIASPERFCADFADRLYQWDYWRGDSWAPGD